MVFEAWKRAWLDLSDELLFITVRPVLEKCHNTTFGLFLGFSRGFSGDFLTKPWKRCRDWLRMRSFDFFSLSGVASLRLWLTSGDCLHFLASGTKKWFLVFSHFRRIHLGKNSPQGHVIFIWECLISYCSYCWAWTENSIHSLGASHWFNRAWRALGDHINSTMAIVGTVNIAKLPSFLHEFSWSGRRKQGETLTHWQEDWHLLQ